MEDVDYINKIPINNRYNVINDYIITSDRRFRNINGLSYKSIVTNVNNNKLLIQKFNNGVNINELSKIYYKNELKGTYYYK